MMTTLDGDEIHIGDTVAWDPMFGASLDPLLPIYEIATGVVTAFREETLEVYVVGKSFSTWLYVDDILNLKRGDSTT